MPIDRDFQAKRKKVGESEGIAVWGPVESPKKLGRRGTNVAVDWDICARAQNIRQGTKILPHGSISVFHLDDSQEQLELAKILLERDDPSIKVTQFQSPSDLLRELTLQRCDCIVTSYHVDRTNIELLAPKIRRVTKVPIILYTALERDAVEKVLASKYLDGFVEKKGDLDHYKELTSMIRGAVEKYRRLHGV